MRKRLITRTPETVPSGGEGWLDLERAAVVEVTSEDNDFPVESALVSGETPGWRAAMPGTETIRLIFDQPQKLKQYRLSLKKKKSRERKSSSCDGLPMAGAHFGKLFASSG